MLDKVSFKELGFRFIHINTQGRQNSSITQPKEMANKKTFSNLLPAKWDLSLHRTNIRRENLAELSHSCII